ncbi:MAG: hypothetical protein QXL34_07320, partial [Thermosphaera sp.]
MVKNVSHASFFIDQLVKSVRDQVEPAFILVSKESWVRRDLNPRPPGYELFETPIPKTESVKAEKEIKTAENSKIKFEDID